MLPSIMGTAAATAPQTAPEDALSKVRTIAAGITGKNWREKKAALLALVG